MDKRWLYFSELLDFALSRYIARSQYEEPMAIQVKGLKEAADRARKALGAARLSVTKMELHATGLAAAAEDISRDLAKHTEDLLFDATTLGNGSPVSDEQKVSSFRDVGLGDLVEKKEAGNAGS